MSELTDPDLTYYIPVKIIKDTLQFLRQKAGEGDEGVVLWPGRLTNMGCEIVSAYIPEQITGPFMYEIPRRAVIEALSWCRKNQCVVPLQVHSHLGDAFHSLADDELAFVQHENGISIVVPYGGAIAFADFVKHAKFFRLVEGTKWQELSDLAVRQRFVWEESNERR